MEKVYQQILIFQENRPKLKKIVLFICKYFPKLTALMYVILLIYLFSIHSTSLLECILKPVFVFISTGLFRKIYNRKRPYETLCITPLVMHKEGESFPSRHMASATIISLTIYSVSAIFSIPAFFITICIGLSRFMVGIHYPSDILAGALFSFIIYCI
ncbi:phosphatase PAP2 family protein [Tannockella kyphosi]|uniref:phosphatase PAP2 family protein n=1 Tax=Tannockella kyphosi TaxID=2899121 RepID=UPI002011BDEE|nr:phosphatase PAP2 family protein [Tannockella kyphosi]